MFSGNEYHKFEGFANYSMLVIKDQSFSGKQFMVVLEPYLYYIQCRMIITF